MRRRRRTPRRAPFRGHRPVLCRSGRPALRRRGRPGTIAPLRVRLRTAPGAPARRLARHPRHGDEGHSMTDLSDLSKPLKTWSHLAGKRRRPSEYEIVSTNLLWSTDDEMPWALSPDIDMNKWYLRYRNNSPLRHDGLGRIPRPRRARLPLLQRHAGRARDLRGRPAPRSCEARARPEPGRGLGGAAGQALYAHTLSAPLPADGLGLSGADRAVEHDRELRHVPGRRPAPLGLARRLPHEGTLERLRRCRLRRRRAQRLGGRPLLARLSPDAGARPCSLRLGRAFRRTQRRRQAGVRRGVHPPARPRGAAPGGTRCSPSSSMRNGPTASARGAGPARWSNSHAGRRATPR